MKHLSFFLTLLLAAVAQAGEPPTAPMLRIETGRHTATLKRIATDSQGRWFATASHDKTLRLWDAKDGSLLQTFRLPSGAGDEGKLYAAAMDPAGDWIAAGGWTDVWGGSTTAIYILDRPTGQLRQRIEGLKQVINHLCVSPDGR
jgi:WD40 repeat protein